MCNSRLSRFLGAGVKVHHGPVPHPPLRFGPILRASVLMARGVRSMGETGCKLLIRSATRMRYCVLGTTSSSILCGQVLPSTCTRDCV